MKIVSYSCSTLLFFMPGKTYAILKQRVIVNSDSLYLVLWLKMLKLHTVHYSVTVPMITG